MKSSKSRILILLALLAPLNVQAIETDFETDASLPLAYVNVVVKGGSVNDPAGQSGISEFLSKMLLRGTKLRSKEQLNQALDQIGAQLEVEARAEAIILRGAALKSELPAFLTLLEEVVTQPSFREEEIRLLKSETLSEILDELGNDQRLASRFFQRFLFGSHPYGAPVNGTKKDVERFTRAQLVAQYDRLFRSEQLLVLGTGDADTAQIQKWSERIALKRPGNGGIQKTPAPQFPSNRRLQIVDKPGRTQSQIYIGLAGVQMTDPKFFPLYLANFTLGGGSFQARLMKEVRAKRGWAYGAYSSYRFGRQPRSWIAYTFPATKDTAPAVGLMLQMIEEMKEKGLTNEEFAFAKSSQINSSAFMYDTPKKRIENVILEKTLDLPDGFMKSYGPAIEKLSKSEVDRAAREFFDSKKVAITVLGTANDIQADVITAAAIPAGQATVVSYENE